MNIEGLTHDMDSSQISAKVEQYKKNFESDYAKGLTTIAGEIAYCTQKIEAAYHLMAITYIEYYEQLLDYLYYVILLEIDEHQYN